MKSLTQQTRKIEKRTWVEKVTDDTNSWLLARNLLREGHFEDAAQQYLEDASEQKEKNVLRAALSISAAARCLASIGKTQESSDLFLKAGMLYESARESENSDQSYTDWISERIFYCQRRASHQENEKLSVEKPTVEK
ncbi:MAG: hypothetical protein JSV56_10970 [Methanomassiliicoccales archaeon]|nr:MAG: hypothetical protein JSV56_10970 [Methanomassiliicoccales archaeon]